MAFHIFFFPGIFFFLNKRIRGGKNEAYLIKGSKCYPLKKYIKTSQSFFSFIGGSDSWLFKY